jgi:acetolactate synthase-1/2/3 large subunit
MRRNGGELLVDLLRQAGIDTIFVLHGGHLDALLQAALDHGVRLVDTRHEAAAGHAADGWARTTGQTGVAVVTAGPGFTNVVTAITNAYLDAVPTLFISGAAPLRDAETLPLQGGIDQVAMVTPITKWAHRVTHTHRIPDLVAQALRVARSGRPGPVFLEIPIDVLFTSADDEALGPIGLVQTTAAPAPTPEVVATMVEWLRAAERPAILAGGGAWFSGATDELVAVAERVGAPVFMNGKSRGMVPAGHPLCGGSFTNLALASMSGAGPADLVVLLGARLGLFTGGRSGSVVPTDAKVIQVDISGEEIGRNRDVDLAVVADCREVLRALDVAAAGVDWPDRSAWLAGVAMVRSAAPAMFAEPAAADEPIHPFRLMQEIAAALPPDAIIAADGGETASWMDMAAQVNHGGHWMTHGYLGCLGTGMPFAIAAQVAHPDRRVLCVVGDGSVGLNFSEFDTMARHGLPIVVVVNNDQMWGMSAHGQDLIYGRERRVVTELGPVRYDLAAAGFGCHAEFVTKASDIGPALERAFASGRPACVNVMTDPEVISPVTMMLVGSLGGGGGDADEGVVIPYYDNIE